MFTHCQFIKVLISLVSLTIYKFWKVSLSAFPYVIPFCASHDQLKFLLSDCVLFSKTVIKLGSDFRAFFQGIPVDAR